MSAIRDSLKIDGRTLSTLALVLSLTPGCITEPDTVDNDASNVLVEIVSMQGQAFDDQGPGDAAVDLFSDVCFAPPGSGCSVFNDNAIVTMRAFLKDPAQVGSDEPTNINHVVFERYRVTYIRADGRNVPGVDVPYPFDGVANFVIPTGSVQGTERGFIIVRHQAKVETPLRELLGSSNFAIISTIAQVDFYGHDLAGRAITVTGYLNITFADFGNS
jgi:hypothetical protein